MRSKTKKKSKAVASVASSILLILAVAVCLFVAFQVTTGGYVSFGGYSMFRVVTGSMEPTLPIGSILLCKEERIEAIQTDDIVCFRSREGGRLGQVVTHRVRAVLQDDSGTVYLETKGDANLSPDGSFVRQDNLIGRVVWHTGEGSSIQSVVSFITGKIGFLACIVVPILLLSGFMLRDNVKNIQKELQKAMDELIVAEACEAHSEFAEGGITQEEYQEMYERIRAELMEELKQNEANQASGSGSEPNEEQ